MQAWDHGSMGFLSGITKTLFGGSDSSSAQQSTSGWSLLPPEIQNTYKNFSNTVNSQIPSALTAYNPISQTSGETQAYDAINKGFAPDQAQLNSDIAMQQNPYDSSVIDTINRQAGGDYSILKQSLNQAGQFGSNRQNLGANDIDLSRLNQIGSFKQNEFNTQLQNALTTLPQLRQQDAAAQLGAGSNQRQLALQQSSAPISGLQEIAKALGILPTSGGSQSTGDSQSSANNAIFKPIGL